MGGRWRASDLQGWKRAKQKVSFRIFRMSSDAMSNVAVPQDSSEAVEIGRLRGSYKAEGARCCPIALQQACEVPAPPEGAAQQGKETSEAMLPDMNKRQEAQEDSDSQRRTDLLA